jgi:hypothetical protein
MAHGHPQGAVSHKHLDYYLDEFTFRFNRRKSKSRGKLFFRLAQQAVAVGPVPHDLIVHPTRKRAKTRLQHIWGYLSQADTHLSTGFDKDHVVLLQLDNASSNIKGTEVVSLSQRLEARVRALPGVQAASFSMLTFNEGQWMAPLWPEGVEHTEANGKDFEGNRVGAAISRCWGRRS